MSWSDALLGGGFALAGVGVQQAFASRSTRLVYQRDQQDRQRLEQHAAFVDLVKAGRRVQRALVDHEAGPLDPAAIASLAIAVDALAETVAAVRLVVADDHLVRQVELFEEHAKAIERGDAEDGHLKLTPLINVLRTYETRGAKRSPGNRSARPVDL